MRVVASTDQPRHRNWWFLVGKRNIPFRAFKAGGFHPGPLEAKRPAQGRVSYAEGQDRRPTWPSSLGAATLVCTTHGHTLTKAGLPGGSGFSLHSSA